MIITDRDNKLYIEINGRLIKFSEDPELKCPHSLEWLLTQIAEAYGDKTWALDGSGPIDDGWEVEISLPRKVT